MPPLSTIPRPSRGSTSSTPSTTEWVAEDRRKLLALARDLINSDYAGHRLTFQLFAQSPPFAHLAAVYRTFDWDGPLDAAERAAGLSARVRGTGKNVEKPAS